MIFSFLHFYRRHIIFITSIGAIAAQPLFFKFFFFPVTCFLIVSHCCSKEIVSYIFSSIGSNYPLNQNLLFKYSLLFFPVTAAYCLISNYYCSVFLIHFRQEKFHAKGFLTNTSVAIVRRTLTL